MKRSLRAILTIILVLQILLCFAACGRTETAAEPEFSVREIVLPDSLELSQGAQLRILCADGARIVCALDTDLDESDPPYRAEGVSAQTGRIVTVDTQEGSVTGEISLEPGQYCNDAVMFSDGILCVVVTFEAGEGECAYECIYSYAKDGVGI